MPPCIQLWTPSLLETEEGSEHVLKFTHPARETGFPDLYQLVGHHPLRPAQFSPAYFPQCTRERFHDYVVTIRKDTDFMKSWQETGENTPNPTEDVDVNIDNGWLKLEEGDMVWVRDLNGTRNPTDDVIRFYYISSGIIDFADRQTLEALAETVLGPPELRTPEPPVKNNKLYTGGTLIERSDRAIPVKSTRCYSIASSHQIAPNIASVAAGSKRTGEDRENLNLRTNINMTVPTIATKYLQRTAPRRFCNVVQRYGDLLNTPSVGGSFQHFYTGVQVNISPVAASAGDTNTFHSSLGEFAVPHIDGHDAASALTAMALLLSIPEGYKPGLFAYHDFKLFIVSGTPSIVFFTGLHLHGGAAPSPPPGQQAEPWAYRLAVICYPNSSTMMGESRNPLAPFCGFDFVKKDPTAMDANRKDVLKIPPEVRFRERPDCNRANLARDGPSVLGPQALLTMFAREHAILVDHTAASLRPELPDYNLEIDYEALLKAFKLTRKKPDEEGGSNEMEVVHPIPWDNAPTADGNTIDFSRALQECVEYMEHFATHTPHYFLNPTPRRFPAVTNNKEHPTDRSAVATYNSETTGNAGADVTVRGRGKKRHLPETSEDEGDVADRDVEATRDRPEYREKRPRHDNEVSAPLVQDPGNLSKQSEINFSIFTGLDYTAIAQEIVALYGAVGSHISTCPPSDNGTLAAITSTTPSALDISKIPSTWVALDTVKNSMEMRTASSRVLTALILTTHSNMWDWFSQHVTEPVLLLQQVPIASCEHPDIQEKMPNDWIFPLFLQVQVARLLSGHINLIPSQFIKGLDAEAYTSTDRRPVLFHVELAVQSWLRFSPLPGSSLPTSRAIATFISVVSRVFRSTDFLYLQYTQDRIKTLRANLTDEKVHLSKVPWDKLSQELKGHELANPASDETIAVKNLKMLLWSVSGLPTPVPSEMAMLYEKAVEVGGDSAARSFTQSIPSPPMLPEPEAPEAEDSPLTIPSSPPSPNLQLSTLSLSGHD